MLKCPNTYYQDSTKNKKLSFILCKKKTSLCFSWSSNDTHYFPNILEEMPFEVWPLIPKPLVQANRKTLKWTHLTRKQFVGLTQMFCFFVFQWYMLQKEHTTKKIAKSQPPKLIGLFRCYLLCPWSLLFPPCAMEID